MIDPISRS